MAKIDLDRMDRIHREKVQHQDKVEASYSIVFDDEKCVQLDTYGSAERKITGKVSQSIRFDRESAKFMVALLKKEFDLTDEDCLVYIDRLKSEEPNPVTVLATDDFAFCDFEFFFDENYDRIESLDTDEMLIAGGKEALIIDRYRVVVPKLHASFRNAVWFCQDEKPTETKEEWDAQSAVTLQYAEKEQDYRKYKLFYTMEMDELIEQLCENSTREIDPDELKCLVEFEK